MYTVPVPSAIQVILKAVTGTHRWSLSLLGSGATSAAWLAERDDERLIVRGMATTSDKPVTYPAEMHILRRLHAARCPVPEPLASSNDYSLSKIRFPWSVTRHVDGKPIKTDTLAAQPARQLGRLLADLHALPVVGYGVIQVTDEAIIARHAQPLDGALERWQDYPLWPLDNTTLDQHAIMRVAPHLRPQLEDLAPVLRDAAQQGEAVLCHSDLHGDHILLDGDNLAGVIDFGDACALPAAWEFAIAARHYGWASVDRILLAYAPFAEKRNSLREQAIKLAIISNMSKLEKHAMRRDSVVKRALTLRALLRALSMLPQTVVAGER